MMTEWGDHAEYMGDAYQEAVAKLLKAEERADACKA